MDSGVCKKEKNPPGVQPKGLLLQNRESMFLLKQKGCSYQVGSKPLPKAFGLCRSWASEAQFWRHFAERWWLFGGILQRRWLLVAFCRDGFFFCGILQRRWLSCVLELTMCKQEFSPKPLTWPKLIFAIGKSPSRKAQRRNIQDQKVAWPMALIPEGNHNSHKRIKMRLLAQER